MRVYLPIGSVVLLKESTKKVMIVGVLQRGSKNPQNIWDYTAVVYPEGFLDANKMIMFNHDQIENVYALGYQDAEQLAFSAKVRQVAKKIKPEEESK